MMDRNHSAIAKNSGLRVAMACLTLFVLSGCAVKQAAYDDPRDPWEGYNRYVFTFNEAVDAVLLKPIATGYHVLLPDFIERGIANAFSNVEELPTALNNFLQGDFVGSAGDLLRFLTNTTLGIFGLFDPATAMGLVKQEEDFGQTLAVWGVGSGPYFVVPLIGPSTLRDLPGQVVDFIVSPVNLVDDDDARLAFRVTRIVSARAGFLEREKLLRELSPDFYQQLKDFYLNRREHLIKDGAVKVEYEEYEELEELEGE